MKRVIDLNLLFCWRPRRDLNPCYRRESIALNRNPNERLDNQNAFGKNPSNRNEQLICSANVRRV